MSDACDCTRYAAWMARMNREDASRAYYRNPRCPVHQGNSFPDREQQQNELRATQARTRKDT